jgi:3-hydroxybutyryl-CoA dehydratase
MAYTTSHLYFDDLDVGAIWESGGRTITQADIVNFAGFSGDFNAIHIDHVYAATTPFRRPIAHGIGVFSIASGLGTMAPPVRTIALLGVREWKFVLPVFIGDTIHLRTSVVEKALKGRGKRGEIVWRRCIVNQDGKTVQEGLVMTLVECRPLEVPVTPKVAHAEANSLV